MATPTLYHHLLGRPAILSTASRQRTSEGGVESERGGGPDGRATRTSGEMEGRGRVQAGVWGISRRVLLSQGQPRASRCPPYSPPRTQSAQKRHPNHSPQTKVQWAEHEALSLRYNDAGLVSSPQYCEPTGWSREWKTTTTTFALVLDGNEDAIVKTPRAGARNTEGITGPKA